ncbi:MAG: hypothetical protein BROFUL_02651 [Candidatus Brocadia fulgida]|jgi:hypothetical protein|uniref:Uncharacterized protein n=1 Tax=Candidatus Brocadia fulgida TaxID=380242 RepID=A0A0M2UVW8_9BACT|nr:MAG: hypothetical protein BROFUL_02651 [Candidatus Brocadia fulgida]MBV6517687.1 hypothetical protein [Candidatus Brocadia fulgida]
MDKLCLSVLNYYKSQTASLWSINCYHKMNFTKKPKKSLTAKDLYKYFLAVRLSFCATRISVYVTTCYFTPLLPCTGEDPFLCVP